MLITENDKLGFITDIVDHEGNVLNGIKSFDTETKEAEIYVYLSNGKVATYWEEKSPKIPSLLSVDGQKISYQIVTAKVVLLGCKAINKETTLEIK